jgi:hypothetical protein
MYDYKEAMVKDIKEYIDDNQMFPEPDETYDDYIQRLESDLWGVDEITGNGSFYYASEEECENYVGHGIRFLIEVITEWDLDLAKSKQFRDAPARYLDCLIRCYLFYECVDKAVDELGYTFKT